MEAAMMPILTSQVRQYQLTTLVHVGSELIFCQFMIVRTVQQAAVLSHRQHVGRFKVGKLT